MTHKELAEQLRAETSHLDREIETCRNLDPGNRNPALGLRRKMFEDQQALVQRKLDAMMCPRCNEGRLIETMHEDRGGRSSMCMPCARRLFPDAYPLTHAAGAFSENAPEWFPMGQRVVCVFEAGSDQLMAGAIYIVTGRFPSSQEIAVRKPMDPTKSLARTFPASWFRVASDQTSCGNVLRGPTWPDDGEARARCEVCNLPAEENSTTCFGCKQRDLVKRAKHWHGSSESPMLPRAFPDLSLLSATDLIAAYSCLRLQFKRLHAEAADQRAESESLARDVAMLRDLLVDLREYEDRGLPVDGIDEALEATEPESK